MASNDTHDLLSLVPPSPYLHAYSIPLLLLSVLLTFAGAFLTLDRTRSFAPRYDAVPGSYKRPRSLSFRLQGGVGGLAVGFLFGVHFSTFLAMLVPSVSTYAPLGPKTFIAVWVLSSVVSTFLGGRWKYCALTFAGLSGGSLLSLSLCVIIHPALLTRIVLTTIITPILLIFTLLPLPRFQHTALRIATASGGAAGTVMAIALLANIPAWANLWERLWVKDGATWGTSKEKALCAGFALFFAAGLVVDTLLHRFFGECPDEKWDSYLANYATNLPNRAGNFKPFVSAWDRMFGAKDKSDPLGDDVAFPQSSTNADDDTKLPPLSPTDFELQSSPGFLKKGRSKGQAFNAKKKKRGGGREGIKFRPLDELEMMTSSDEEGSNKDAKSLSQPARPWLHKKASITSSTPTLVDGDGGGDKKTKDPSEIDYDKEIKKLRSRNAAAGSGLRDGEIPEYSDHEEDVTSARRHRPHSPAGTAMSSRSASKHPEDWSPGFMKKSSKVSHSAGTGSQVTAVDSSRYSHETKSPLGAVPATPSLLKALDRLAVAQKDAFGHTPSYPASPTQTPREGLPPSGGKSGETLEDYGAKGVKWDQFWKDVKGKTEVS